MSWKSKIEDMDQYGVVRLLDGTYRGLNLYDSKKMRDEYRNGFRDAVLGGQPQWAIKIPEDVGRLERKMNAQAKRDLEKFLDKRL